MANTDSHNRSRTNGADHPAGESSRRRQHSRSLNQPQTEAVFHALLRTWGLLKQVQEPYFTRFGISGAQWAILRVLQRAKAQGQDDLSLTEVGERLFIQPPSVTAVVDRMERQGLVKRIHSKTDLRVRHLSLTPYGRKLVTRVLRQHAERIDSLFDAFEPGEHETLLALVKKLEAHLRTMAADEAAGS